MRKSGSFVFLTVVLLAGYMLPATAWGASIEPGQFLGLFTHTEARNPLAQQAGIIERRLQHNPYLKGLTIRVLWKEEEPTQGGFEWSAVDRMIAIAHQRHIYYTLDPIAGIMTPEWVYGAGVKRFEAIDVNPHHPTYGQTRSQPVPWDSTYHRLYRNFLTQLAARYGNDPSLLEVTINGHNTTAEMHMPRRPEDMERWRQFGWTPELVETDWKSWIDFFAQTFPHTHIGLMLSPMYGEGTKSVVERLTAYAVSRYGSRLILMTAALDGRRDQSYMFQTHVILGYPQIPNAQETVSSFVRDPQRQGTMQIFVYNMRQLSPIFVRLWPADANNVELCSSLVSEYQRARSMSLASLRSELQSKGLYTTVDTYSAANGQGRRQAGKFGRFGSRQRSSMSQQGYPGQGTAAGEQPGGTYPGENAYPPPNRAPQSNSPSEPNDFPE